MCALERPSLRRESKINFARSGIFSSVDVRAELRYIFHTEAATCLPLAVSLDITPKAIQGCQSLLLYYDKSNSTVHSEIFPILGFRATLSDLSAPG